DLQVAQVRAHQHLPALAAGPNLRADAVGVVHFELTQVDAPVPDIDLVQQGVGEGHELPIDRARAGRQLATSAPVGQVTLVGPDAFASAAPEQIEIQHDQVQQ